MKQIIFIVLALATLLSCGKEEPSLYTELKDIHELSLAEVRVEKTFIIDDPDIHFRDIGARSGIFVDMVDWVKKKASVGKRIGIYSFGTYFSAYINLDELSPEDVILNKKDKTCTLTLPAIHIKEWGRDFEVKTEHERVSVYRSSLTPQEKARAKDEASRILSEEMEKNGRFRQELMNSAQDKARSYFSSLLSNWGYQSHIQFREE
ncbi:hypothetical protein M2459_000477 [Parabacteroides sp. PF5-5]|uniref:DUF4230 domain-containing protein n=1 Tax=unclassified Parabacteroides TaxID=2649774 RepID=UPI0024738B9E|nr:MULTISPECIES: DUF4230 domain-containing protein [unclassified Parabacteroides]MDH6303589.1 hypothetical protein [Parabacteroides sp. PH5-39]MDH6314911.1 hypothetical protein [Parabacteroides sp. PF5-13]MDH6318248.1 hypothetical protein [Parabacteroides sp. PH5-13]MDH6321819.1 hypothetical protein [Parabacteroides sp. PH5-8]MDH6325943.1 hypothetical protein [Parabacteroides sp. PH5-41]